MSQTFGPNSHAQYEQQSHAIEIYLQEIDHLKAFLIYEDRENPDDKLSTNTYTNI